MKNFLKPTRVTWAAFALHIFILFFHVVLSALGILIIIAFGGMKGGSHAGDYVEFIAQIFQRGFNLLFYPFAIIAKTSLIDSDSFLIIMLISAVIYSYIVFCLYSWFFSIDWTHFSSSNNNIGSSQPPSL